MPAESYKRPTCLRGRGSRAFTNSRRVKAMGGRHRRTRSSGRARGMTSGGGSTDGAEQRRRHWQRRAACSVQRTALPRAGGSSQSHAQTRAHLRRSSPRPLRGIVTASSRLRSTLHILLATQGPPVRRLTCAPAAAAAADKQAFPSGFANKKRPPCPSAPEHTPAAHRLPACHYVQSALHTFNTQSKEDILASTYTELSPPLPAVCSSCRRLSYPRRSQTLVLADKEDRCRASSKPPLSVPSIYRLTAPALPSVPLQYAPCCNIQPSHRSTF